MAEVQVAGVKPGLGERAAWLVEFALATIRAAIILSVLGAFFFMLVDGVFAGDRQGPEAVRTSEQEPSGPAPVETRAGSHPLVALGTQVSFEEGD